MNPIINVQYLSKLPRTECGGPTLLFRNKRRGLWLPRSNGAGKSTTIRMLLTLIEPSGGLIVMFGHDLKTNRNKILAQVGAITSPS